jgi:hypothetical protein
MLYQLPCVEQSSKEWHKEKKVDIERRRLMYWRKFEVVGGRVRN